MGKGRLSPGSSGTSQPPCQLRLSSRSTDELGWQGLAGGWALLRALARA